MGTRITVMGARLGQARAFFVLFDQVSCPSRPRFLGTSLLSLDRYGAVASVVTAPKSMITSGCIQVEVK